MKNAKDIDWRASVIGEVTQDIVIEGNKILAGTACYPTNLIKHDSIEINFPPPSLTALYLSMANKNYDASKELYEMVINDCINDEYCNLFDYYELSISAILFSFSAIESFANEKIAQDKYYEKKFKNGIYGALSSDSIEWLSLDEKIGDVLPQQLNIQTIKGTTLWQSYINLRKIRNKIVHPTKKDLNRSNILTGKYPVNIWHNLIKSNDKKYPEVAKKIIFHFEDKQNPPHWLKYYKYNM
ncbi:MAG: hypothetical protein HGA59_06545 [Chlorobiaceae bacterium]|nr:hypothetical protein [Chlorobiaceae bacterium]NTV15832.1 hypothetical protein [Chlorobiaceae bacterium]